MSDMDNRGGGPARQIWTPLFRVFNENNETYEDPSEDLLYDLLSELTPVDNRFMAVVQLDGTDLSYIQVFLWPDGLYTVEYQEGSVTEHFQSPPVESRDEVLAALKSYAYQYEEWRTAFEWTRQDQPDVP